MKKIGGLRIKGTETVISPEVFTCEGLMEKIRGLIGKDIHPEQALLIEDCWSIHTCFMREAIDVIFVDRSFKILKIRKAMQPFKTCLCPGAYGVIEMKAHTLKDIPLEEGNAVTIS